MLTSRHLRPPLMNWFEMLEPNLYVTHNFGYRVSLETREKSLTRYYNWVQSHVYGRNWNKRDTDQPMVAVGFWEHLDSNPHCHVLVAATDDERAWLLGQGNNGWLAQQPRGQFNISDIDSLQKVIAYITKTCHCADSLDQLFVYKAPPAKSLI
jgi:hypothetical protein